MISKAMIQTPSCKYARIERERRFLVGRFPDRRRITRVRRITDRYIEGTNLRLREEKEEGQPALFKLTQKIAAPGDSGQQGYTTTMYLDREAHGRLAELVARTLKQVRYSVPPFGVDVFEGLLEGLVMAEAEFDSAAQADGLLIPNFVSHEVSRDLRFSGGALARASRQELQTWLAEYGATVGDTGAGCG